MNITTEQVKKVAQLARLEIADEAVTSLAAQLAAILDYVEKLNEVDTTEVETTAHAVTLTNAFREDEVHTHLDRRSALANAPLSEEGGFIVPKVI